MQIHPWRTPQSASTTQLKVLFGYMGVCGQGGVLGVTQFSELMVGGDGGEETLGGGVALGLESSRFGGRGPPNPQHTSLAKIVPF